VISTAAGSLRKSSSAACPDGSARTWKRAPNDCSKTMRLGRSSST
jgi:hypothetical protein